MKEKKKYKYDIIADTIMGEIASGKWKPGDKLPSESELTASYGISRVTLRESLKKLSMMGVLRIIQGDGTYIQNVTPSSFIRPLLPLLAFNRDNLIEIYEVRMCVEGSACALAAQRRSQEAIIQLQSLIGKMRESLQVNNYKVYNECDIQFHASIVRACNDDTLIAIFLIFQQVIEEYIDQVNMEPRILSRSFLEHQQILLAITNQNSELADVAMRAHLSNTRDSLLRQHEKISS